MTDGAGTIIDLVDSAPVFEDTAPATPAPKISAEIREAAQDELRAAMASIGAAANDDRSSALSAASEAIGQLVASDALNAAFARAAIESAALDAGMIRDFTLRGVRQLINAGLKAGAKAPRDLGSLRRSAPKKRQSRPRLAAAQSPSSSPDGEDLQPSSSSSSASSPSSSSAPPDPLGGEKEQSQTLASESDIEAENTDIDGDGDEPPPPDDIPADTFRYCAELDHSDVDNGKRLLAYFGRDLLVRQEDDVAAGQLLAWTGTHWDLSGGEALAHLIGQKVGDLIKVEAGYIEYSPAEERAVHAGEAAARQLKSLDADADKAQIFALQDIIERADKARAARSKRRANRKKWGVATKNAGRISNMIKCAAPHLRQHPDAFNANPLKVATLTHTLTFVVKMDPENPDPDTMRPLVDPETNRVQYELNAKPGHDRDDMLTAVIPHPYVKGATSKEWTTFLDLFQPEMEKRRTVQSFSGMGLTAQPVQRVMYHTGTGGNGKSVFLEVMSRVLGDGLSVGVPAETVSGQAQNNPSAPTPDIARCYAKRFLRIAELPKDVPLKAETIKKLTGGERWPVRTMYKGYFEFKPTAKPHMSGNGKPRFDGADGGMERRLIIVPWSVTLDRAKHRDFEEVVSEIAAEGAGILNWLIAGALDFLNSGFVIAEDVLAATASHVSDMDPCQQFIDAHVRPDVGGAGVGARAMYEGYKRWAEANGMAIMKETRFGLTMKQKIPRDDTKRVHVYVDVHLVDLPDAVAHAGEHPPDRGGPPIEAYGDREF